MVHSLKLAMAKLTKGEGLIKDFQHILISICWNISNRVPYLHSPVVQRWLWGTVRAQWSPGCGPAEGSEENWGKCELHASRPPNTRTDVHMHPRAGSHPKWCQTFPGKGQEQQCSQCFICHILYFHCTPFNHLPLFWQIKPTFHNPIQPQLIKSNFVLLNILRYCDTLLFKSLKSFWLFLNEYIYSAMMH